MTRWFNLPPKRWCGRVDKDAPPISWFVYTKFIFLYTSQKMIGYINRLTIPCFKRNGLFIFQPKHICLKVKNTHGVKKIKTCTNKGQPWNERKYEKRGMKGSNSTFIVPRLNATSAYKIELVKRSCRNTIVFLDSPTYTPPTKDYSWLGPQKIVVSFKTQHKQYTLWSRHTFMSQCHANFYYLFPQVGNVAQKQISPKGKEKRRHT
jgi:hypothetical protein